MADTAIPVYQTVNSKGEATAEFEAVIKALGLILPESVSLENPENQNRIVWRDAAEKIMEEIFGSGAGTVSLLRMWANRELTRIGGETSINAFGKFPKSVAGTGQARLVAGINDTGVEGRGIAYAQVSPAEGAGAFLATILDQANQSSFLKLAALSNRSIAFGESEVEFNPAAVITAFKTISHGLGVAPLFVGVSLIAGEDGGIWSTALLKEIGAVNFKVRYRVDTERVLGTKMKTQWVAIG